MSTATAPNLFAQADLDHDNSVSLVELTNQLKLIGISSDTAAQLFESLKSSKSAGLSVDDYVKGVAAANASNNSVFQDLFLHYTSSSDGTFNTEAFASFMAQGASVAAQYWSEHPEWQRRS